MDSVRSPAPLGYDAAMAQQPRMRPEFTRPMKVDPGRFYAALARALSDDALCKGQTYAAGAILRLRHDERRVWSPALHLHVDGEGQGPWQLHGRFSPSSPVWTAFVAIYLTLAILGIGAACYGGAQIILQQAPWAFVGVPFALALAAFTYGAAFIGQGLGASDMYQLRSFVDRVADAAADEP